MFPYKLIHRCHANTNGVGGITKTDCDNSNPKYRNVLKNGEGCRPYRLCMKLRMQHTCTPSRRIIHSWTGHPSFFPNIFASPTCPMSSALLMQIKFVRCRVVIAFVKHLVARRTFCFIRVALIHHVATRRMPGVGCVLRKFHRRSVIATRVERLVTGWTGRHYAI